MPLFNFTIPNLVITWLLAISYIIIAKILVHDLTLRLKEVLYTVFTGAFFAFIFQVAQSATINLPYISNLIFIFSIYLYYFRITKKSFQASFTLAIAVFAIALIIELLTIGVITLFFPYFPDIRELAPSALYIILVYTLSVGASFFVGNILRKNLYNVMQVSNLHSTLALIAAFIFFFFQIIITIQYYIGHTATLFSWDSVLILGYIFATLACFWFYAKFKTEKSVIEQKEIEHRNLLYYMDESEHQQTAIRKFKHDYQNILISIDSFLEDDDLPGLKQYYLTKIKPASNVITQDAFALEGLGKIKVREIRGILTAKLVMAQNLGLDVEFQIVEDIDSVSADSFVLVRMLGIILDNAIEALTELSHGKLEVACYKSGSSVTFVVQNTCPPDLPPYSQLKQAGFSTKADGRGLGLSNLWELANANPNITIQTNVHDGNFIQKLSLREA